MKKFLQNEYLFSIISRSITIALAFLKSVITARYLGASLKGTSEYILSIISIGSIMITFGMHQAYPYLRRKYGKNNIFEDYISIITVMFAVYLVVALIVGFFIISTLEIKVAVILIPIFGYADIMAYVCLVENPNKRNIFWTLISTCSLVFSFVLWKITYASILWMIVILVFEELLKCIIYTIAVKPRICFHKKTFSLLFELVKFGFFPMVALLLTTLNYKIDVLMLKSYDFISSAQIGVYSIGLLFADKIALIPDTLKGVLVSKLAKGADEHEVAKVSRICFCSTFVFCLLVLSVGKPVIEFLYGDEYDGAYSVLLICSFGTIFIGYFKLIAQYNIINKKQIRNVVFLSVSVLINIFLNRLLIPEYYLQGAAFASGMGYFLSGIIFVIWFAKSNKIKLSEMFIIQKSDFLNLCRLVRKRGE